MEEVVTLSYQRNKFLWYDRVMNGSENLSQLWKSQQTNKSLLSDVFFNTTKLEATIDIYTPVSTSHLLGVVRATLNMYSIWDIVNRVASDRGDGSYASIIDQNGVRVAYTTRQTNSTYNYSATNNPSGYSRPPELFTAIAPLTSHTNPRTVIQ